MEKKNGIVLAVIAIVLILLAAVGITYAYFTTQVIVKNNDQNTTEIRTATLASATMDMGYKVTANDIHPGSIVVKSVNVTGSCGSEGTGCDPVAAVISITDDIDRDVFGNDIEWALYQSDSEFTCRNVVTSSTGETITEGTTTTVTNQYQANATCKVGTVTEATTEEEFKALPDVDFDSLTKVIDNSSDSHDAEIQVDDTTNDNYYLVVSYKNNGIQDTQQNKFFTVSIGFSAKALD